MPRRKKNKGGPPPVPRRTVSLPQKEQSLLKRGVSKAIDAFAMGMAPAADSILPGSGVLVHSGRELLRDLTGFSERRVAVRGGSGTVVTTQSAPVAFPRRPDGVRGRLLGITRDGHELHHVHDMMFTTLTTAGTANTFNISAEDIIPAAALTFPNMASRFQSYERYKVRRLRVHFEHVQGTGAVAVVGLGWQPDPDKALPTGASQAAAQKNIVEGACYEDFSLDVDPADLASVCGAGLYNDATSVTADDKFNVCGAFFVYTDLNSATSQVVGRIWIEAVVELWDQRAPTAGTGILLRAEQALAKDVDRQKVIQDATRALQEYLQTVGVSRRTGTTAGACSVPSTALSQRR